MKIADRFYNFEFKNTIFGDCYHKSAQVFVYAFRYDSLKR